MSWNGGKETKYLGVDPNVGMIFSVDKNTNKNEILSLGSGTKYDTVYVEGLLPRMGKLILGSKANTSPGLRDIFMIDPENKNGHVLRQAIYSGEGKNAALTYTAFPMKMDTKDIKATFLEGTGGSSLEVKDGRAQATMWTAYEVLDDKNQTPIAADFQYKGSKIPGIYDSKGKDIKAWFVGASAENGAIKIKSLLTNNLNAQWSKDSVLPNHNQPGNSFSGYPSSGYPSSTWTNITIGGAGDDIKIKGRLEFMFNPASQGKNQSLVGLAYARGSTVKFSEEAINNIKQAYPDLADFLAIVSKPEVKNLVVLMPTVRLPYYQTGRYSVKRGNTY